jgi:integrin beta 8
MTQATLAACNAQLNANWAADPVIGRTLTGTGAPAPTLGNIGDIYFRTSNKTIYGPKTNSGWGNGTSIAGAAGAAGADGKSVLSGAGAPGAGVGANGDFYIDTTAHAIYGPKAAGAWGSPTSLVGGG